MIKERLDLQQKERSFYSELLIIFFYDLVLCSTELIKLHYKSISYHSETKGQDDSPSMFKYIQLNLPLTSVIFNICNHNATNMDFDVSTEY